MRQASKRFAAGTALLCLVGVAAVLAPLVADRDGGSVAPSSPVRTIAPSPTTGPAASAAPTAPTAPTEAPSKPEPTREAAPVDEPPAAPEDADASAAYQRALAAASSLGEIDATQAIPQYRRDSFGDGWVDVDRNGCSTRNDVLERDLAAVTWLPDRRCVVATGTLQDPYTGASIPFFHDAVAPEGNRGSQGVQVDHIISLSAAHAGGAWAWTEPERVAFANDPDTLLAVDGGANASKGDRGPSAWLPDDPAYWCDYSARYVGIAVEYGLAVERADRLMLQDVLQACV
jgi:hypothetical protein